MKQVADVYKRQVLACDAEPESAKLKYLFDVAPASACLTPELLRLVTVPRTSQGRL